MEAARADIASRVHPNGNGHATEIPPAAQRIYNPLHGPSENNGTEEKCVIPKTRAYLQGDGAALGSDLAERKGIELTPAVLNRIKAAAQNHFEAMYDLLRNDIFPAATYSFPEHQVISWISQNVERHLTEHPDKAVIILDRLIYKSVMASDISDDVKKRIGYFGLTRKAGTEFASQKNSEDAHNGKVPRVGDEPFHVQGEKLRKMFDGKTVVLVDDVSVGGGTMTAAAKILSGYGVDIDKDVRNHVTYFRAVRTPSGRTVDLIKWREMLEKALQSNDVTSAAIFLKSIASIEERELTPLGGSTDRTNKRNTVGVQVPAFPPFSDGAAIRMNDRLELIDFTKKIIDLNIRFFSELEEALHAGDAGKRDIKLIDVRHALPVDKGVVVNGLLAKAAARTELEASHWLKSLDQAHLDGPTIVYPFIEKCIRSFCPNEEADRNNEPIGFGRFLKFIRETRIVDLLVKAKEEVEKMLPPEIEVVGSGIDGTLNELRRDDPRDTDLGFSGSVLERLVSEKQVALLKKLGVDHSVAVDTISGNVGCALAYFAANHGKTLENPQSLERNSGKQWVDIGKDLVRRVYKECGLSSEAAEEFIDSMPGHYHAYRAQTWDFTNPDELDQIYGWSDAPINYVQEVLSRGGKLVFVSEGPRIHALNTLKASGILKHLKEEDFKLYTVEDLYLKDSVPWNLDEIPGEMHGKVKELADKYYVQQDKGTFIAEHVAKELNVPTNRISFAGDQLRDDVKAPQEQGIPCHAIAEPPILLSYIRRMRLPGDKPEQHNGHARSEKPNFTGDFSNGNPYQG
ncbi:MAG: phosphoribosyltransferase [Deltaproteobacteria bacterium]|nr:phosphoribosyltransferase [Deltaproteobacteria bacterium]